MNSEDFMTFVENLADFRKAKIDFIETNKKYPVGTLSCNNKTITIYFVHYESCEEVERKWKERYERINYNNVCVLMTDRDGFNEVILERFKKLSYKKLLFTARELKEENTVFVKEFEKEKQVGDLIAYATLTGKRHYEKFNIVDWLNVM